MENLLNFRYAKGEKEIFPAHPMVKHWLFNKNEEEEALLAHAMASVAQKNGLSENDLQHLFPAVLRMLKDKNSVWSK